MDREWEQYQSENSTYEVTTGRKETTHSRKGEHSSVNKTLRIQKTGIRTQAEKKQVAVTLLKAFFKMKKYIEDFRFH